MSFIIHGYLLKRVRMKEKETNGMEEKGSKREGKGKNSCVQQYLIICKYKGCPDEGK